MGKVLFSQVSVCPHPEGTSSQCHNTSTGSMSFLGGTPSPSHNTSPGSRSLPWGRVVPLFQMGGGGPRTGYPLATDGVPLCQSGMEYPLAMDGVPPSQGWGTQDRTTEGVLSKRRAVFLLRSRRRTYLCYILYLIHIKNITIFVH